jgi:hypothetical protein
MVAVWQGLLELQEAPGVQPPLPQVPLVQVRPEPHTVPSGLLPASVQVLPGQLVVPLWQGLAGWQLPPGVHAAPQVPLVQTMPVPQAVPSG